MRKDDNPETVADRLAVYHRETEPLVAFYEGKGLLAKIDGSAAIDAVVEAFLAAVQ